MKFDLHTHHERCGHADGTIEDYIQAAIDLELQVIGISDHCPYFESNQDQLKPGIAMSKSEFPGYVAEVLQLKEKYTGQIEVLLGIEVDFFPAYLNVYQNLAKKYPFDYLISSVHVSNQKHIFDPTRWDNLSRKEILKEKEIYYQRIQEMVRCHTFDIIGHIDAIKAYNLALSTLETDVVDQTLKMIAQSDMAMEINTSGKLKDCREWYPVEDILEKAYFYGVKVTFGSDAHIPSRVGDEWIQVRDMLQKIGYTELAVFRNRKRTMVSL